MYANRCSRARNWKRAFGVVEQIEGPLGSLPNSHWFKSSLGSDPNAPVKVFVEVSSEFPDGAKDSLKRGVSENARTPGFKGADWE